MATFPLKCTICSMEHSYSDVSHLLTHMSSKRHLSTYFNTTVRARQDATLAGKLYHFDCWYNQNNLEQLLAERLSKKDEKKLGLKAPRAPSSRYKRKNTRREESHGTIPEQQQYDSTDGGNNTVLASPHDSHMYIKDEPGLYTQDTVDGYTLSFGDSSHNPNPTEHNSHARLWHSFGSPVQSRGTEHQDDGYPWLAESASLSRSGSIEFGGPLMQGARGIGHLNSEALLHYGQDTSPEVTATHHQNSSPLLGKKKPTALKGIIWPGMLLFDAASPKSKRMRNQRKNHGTARMLQRFSENSQPIEVIYLPNTWTVKEKRPIDGEVHSPLPEILPLPRKSKQRRILAEISTNRPSQKNNRLHQQHVEEDDRHLLSKQFQQGGPKGPGLRYQPDSVPTDKNHYGSSYGLDMYHSRYDDFERQPPSTTYPFLSSNSFVRGEPTSADTFRMHGQQILESAAPLSLSNTVAGTHRPMFGNNSTAPEAILIKSEADEPSEDCLPNLNCPLFPLSSRESLPHIGTFDHFYNMNNYERSQHSVANLQTEPSSYRQNQSYANSTLNEHSLIGPQTPIRAICTYENFASNNRDILEESSGDETIDQGIDYTPTRYLTRSAARLMERRST